MGMTMNTGTKFTGGEGGLNTAREVSIALFLWVYCLWRVRVTTVLPRCVHTSSRASIFASPPVREENDHYKPELLVFLNSSTGAYLQAAPPRAPLVGYRTLM